MTTIPAAQAFSIVGFSASPKEASIKDRLRLLAHDVVERVYLPLDRTFGVFDLELELPFSGALPTATGDPLHLLAPVVSEEIVREVDEIRFLSWAKDRGLRPSIR